MNSSGITNWRGLVFLFRLRRFEGISCEMKMNDKKLKNTKKILWKFVKFPFLQRKEVGSISANSVWIPFHPDLNCGGVVKTFQRGESQVWISALLTWVGLSRFLPCVSAGSYSRGEMELIKKKLIKIYAEKIPRIHAFSPPELKRLFVIDKKKGGGGGGYRHVTIPSLH